MLEDMKRCIGCVALDGYVREGMVVGLGSGSTAEEMVRELGERVRGGLRVHGVPSSRATEALAKSEGIPLFSLDACERIDVTLDGADEIVLKDFTMIKGGGGCLLWEKMVSKFSEEVVVLVEKKKCVEFLGRFPLPIEVVAYGYGKTMRMIEKCYRERGMEGVSLGVREKGGEFFMTDSGHYIVDVEVSSCLCDVVSLERALNGIAGVVDNGLFCGVAGAVVVGEEEGEVFVYSGGEEVRASRL